MRLLNAKSLELEEFWDVTKTPPYAILSHTWEKEEVSFQAIANLESASQLQGFWKIKACCKQALIDGYNWAWIDTCCIDKSSSAELSEAINSMYQWYKNSGVCYAFLSDVPFDHSLELEVTRSAFAKSRWFTRGWTLQELIAPDNMEFFSREWTKLGNRIDLSSEVSEITGIPGLLLERSDTSEVHQNVLLYSVAQRMSWASKRTTTRIEDSAYCLLGIFDVNMPLLYGEGQKSFLRLQEEILKRSDDHTLFAWTAEESVHENITEQRWASWGLLAATPAYFKHSGRYYSPLRGIYTKLPYSMTNVGLCISLPVIQVAKFEVVAVLDCYSTLSDSRVGVHLSLLSGGDLDVAATITARRCVNRKLAIVTEKEYGGLPERIIYVLQGNLR